MIWAVNSLFPEWQPVVVMMSRGGTALGVGVVTGSDPAKPPGVNKHIHGVANKVRDGPSKAVRPPQRSSTMPYGLYHAFSLNFRHIELLLAERTLMVSHESVHRTFSATSDEWGLSRL